MDSTELAKKSVGGSAPVPMLDSSPTAKLVYRDADATAGNLFVAIGAALTVVGLVDIGLLWFPMQLGTAGWEFATVSRTFTNAPMTMVGLVLMAFGLVRRRTRPAMVKRVAVVFAGLSFVLVAMGMLFGLAAPAVLSQVSGEEAVGALKRAMVKNGIEIVVYPTVLLVIAAILWNAVWEDK